MPHPLPSEDVLIGQQRLDFARLIRLQIAESVLALGQQVHGVVVDRLLTAVQELGDGIDHILLRIQQIVGMGRELVQIPLGFAPHHLPDQLQRRIQYGQEGVNVDGGVLLLFQLPILILEPGPHVVGQLQRIIRKLTSGEELPGKAPQVTDAGCVEAALRGHRDRLVLLLTDRQYGGKLRALHSAPIERHGHP